MALQWCKEADSALEKLMSDGCRDTDYVIFTLEGKNNMAIQPGHLGKGGRDKVEEILSSDATSNQVMTGAFLALAVDERGSVVSTRRKYIHFTWVGPSVGVMVKGRVNSMSGGFRDRFPGAVIYLQLMGDLDTLKAKTLEKNMLAAGGAHKPTRYDFTNAGLDGTQVGGTAVPPKQAAPSPPLPVEESKPAQVAGKPETSKPSLTNNTPLSVSSQQNKPAFEAKLKPSPVTIVTPAVELAEQVKADPVKKSDPEPEPAAEPAATPEPATPVEENPAESGLAVVGAETKSEAEPAADPTANPEPAAPAEENPAESGLATLYVASEPEDKSATEPESTSVTVSTDETAVANATGDEAIAASVASSEADPVAVSAEATVEENEVVEETNDVPVSQETRPVEEIVEDAGVSPAAAVHEATEEAVSVSPEAAANGSTDNEVEEIVEEAVVVDEAAEKELLEEVAEQA
jgi:hypothetical protein